MRAEVNALEVISKQTDIPVPEIFFYNPNKDLIDNEYFFMQYIDDLPFDKVLPELSPKQVKKVNIQLGEYTREIHNIVGEKFGYILSGQTGYEKWSDAFASFVDNLLQDAKDGDVKLDIDIEECRKLVVEKKAALDSVKDPHFLHGDLWWGNIFVDPKKLKITAITDWERTLFGDILFEFVFGFIEDIDSFNIGYGNKRRCSENDLYLTGLYNFYNLLLIIVEGVYRKYEDYSKDEAQARTRLMHEFIRLKSENYHPMG
jgi:aminoglycoside phosphotransferase (APT) family kinase protein